MSKKKKLLSISVGKNIIQWPLFIRLRVWMGLRWDTQYNDTMLVLIKELRQEKRQLWRCFAFSIREQTHISQDSNAFFYRDETGDKRLIYLRHFLMLHCIFFCLIWISFLIYIHCTAQMAPCIYMFLGFSVESPKYTWRHEHQDPIRLYQSSWFLFMFVLTWSVEFSIIELS